MLRSLLPARIAGAIALSLLFCPPATAEDLVDATQPEKILDIAREWGSAELRVDAANDPLIAARLNEYLGYEIVFFGCGSTHQACDHIQFRTRTKAPENALEVVNKWNSETRFGRAYVDPEGIISIEMDVDLTGGVSTQNLRANFLTWHYVTQIIPFELNNAPTEAADTGSAP